MVFSSFRIHTKRLTLAADHYDTGASANELYVAGMLRDLLSNLT